MIQYILFIIIIITNYIYIYIYIYIHTIYYIIIIKSLHFYRLFQNIKLMQ